MEINDIFQIYMRSRYALVLLMFLYINRQWIKYFMSKANIDQRLTLFVSNMFDLCLMSLVVFIIYADIVTRLDEIINLLENG